MNMLFIKETQMTNKLHFKKLNLTEEILIKTAIKEVLDLSDE